MRRLLHDYTITAAHDGEIDALIAVDLAAGQLFAGTGLIAGEALLDHVPRGVFETGIRQGNVFTARDAAGLPVGFTLASQRGGTFYLDQISVDPAHGRKGLGRALIARLFDEARTRGYRLVTLSTFRDLAWNGPFYRQLGFREVARQKMADWMLELEHAQAASLDVSKRCFMRRRVSWL
jgi:GNAT superfamily N-acetyltransferase